MKTKILSFFTVTIFLATSLNAQKTYVPDDNFEQKLIQLGYDNGPLDDSVLTSTVSDVLFLELGFSGIEDLTGIEDFGNLISLTCNNNQLTTLDLSSNNNLVVLFCGSNELTSLNVSASPVLELLDCDSNQLTSIDVANNPILDFFVCSNNQLTSVDVSNNPELERFQVYNNQITSIDLSNNPVLDLFSCGGNLVTSLDVSNNLDLRFLNCRVNQLTHLDVSNNTALEQFYCFGNNLETITMTNGNNTSIIGFRAENNPNLLCIEVDDEAYSSANWTSGGLYFNFDAQTSFSQDCADFLGVDESEQINELHIYPTPTSDVLNIELAHNATYTLHSILGQNVLQSGSLQQGKNVIDISFLNNGIYTLKTTLENGNTLTKKLVKQ